MCICLRDVCLSLIVPISVGISVVVSISVGISVVVSISVVVLHRSRTEESRIEPVLPHLDNRGL